MRPDPGSDAKLALSAAALESLGPDFRFKTSFLAKKEDRGKRALSALVWRGTGSSISGRGRRAGTRYSRSGAPRSRPWASRASSGWSSTARLRAARRLPAWPPEELSYWYAAQTSAISFNDNCVDLLFSPGAKPGRRRASR